MTVPKYPDGYEPTDWVLSIVDHRFKGYAYDDGRTRVWVCFGYDPRRGFWMRTDDIGETREVNISERAIDRTWHRVRGVS